MTMRKALQLGIILANTAMVIALTFFTTNDLTN